MVRFAPHLDNSTFSIFPLFSFSDLPLSTASSITLLVVGGSGVIGFVLWEKYAAKFPLIPFSLLRNRLVSCFPSASKCAGADQTFLRSTVIASLFIAVLHPTALSIASGFFYTFCPSRSTTHTEELC